MMTTTASPRRMSVGFGVTERSPRCSGMSAPDASTIETMTPRSCRLVSSRPGWMEAT
jgi:hypothetical protein